MLPEIVLKFGLSLLQWNKLPICPPIPSSFLSSPHLHLNTALMSSHLRCTTCLYLLSEVLSRHAGILGMCHMNYEGPDSITGSCTKKEHSTSPSHEVGPKAKEEECSNNGINTNPTQGFPPPPISCGPSAVVPLNTSTLRQRASGDTLHLGSKAQKLKSETLQD